MPRLSRLDALCVVDALALLVEQPECQAYRPDIERIRMKLLQRLAQHPASGRQRPDRESNTAMNCMTNTDSKRHE